MPKISEKIVYTKYFLHIYIIINTLNIIFMKCITQIHFDNILFLIVMITDFSISNSNF